MAVRHVKNLKASASSLGPFRILPHTCASPRIFPISSGERFGPNQTTTTPVVRGSLIKPHRQTLGRATSLTTVCGFKAAASAMTGLRALVTPLPACHWFIRRPWLGSDRTIGTGVACLTLWHATRLVLGNAMSRVFAFPRVKDVWVT